MSDNSYIDHVLTNWCLDPKEIHEYLNELDDVQWAYVCNNRTNYARFIIDAINFYDPAPIEKMINAKYKIYDLTDYEMFKMKREKEEVYNKKMMAAWEKYKIDNDIHREILPVDTKCDEVYMQLQEEREKLESIVAKRASKYSTPAKRAVALTTVKEYVDQKAKIDTLENEFKTLVKKISLVDINWEYTQRNKFEDTIFSVQERLNK